MSEKHSILNINTIGESCELHICNNCCGENLEIGNTRKATRCLSINIYKVENFYLASSWPMVVRPKRWQVKDTPGSLKVFLRKYII